MIYYLLSKINKKKKFYFLQKNLPKKSLDSFTRSNE